MKTDLMLLVHSINEKGHLGKVGLLSDGKTFAVSDTDENWMVEIIFYGELLPNSGYNIKEIIYDSSQITEMMYDTDKEIEEYLKVNYNL